MDTNTKNPLRGHEYKFEKIDEVCWEMPRVGSMRAPGRIFADERLLDELRRDKTYQQFRNVCCMPGIIGHACLMPDGHQGYGMPIGGVVALDCTTGGISPGAIGYDINCGVRLMRTDLKAQDIKGPLEKIAGELFRRVPAGMGRSRLKVREDQLNEVLNRGAAWAVEQGYGNQDDLEHCEEQGTMPGARAEAVSEKAIKRGNNQLGTLGSGNHFLEIQVVEKVFDTVAAEAFGITGQGQVVVMIHCGSRGLGHQTCSDYLRMMEKEFRSLVSELPDRELIYAPGGSESAKRYFSAMAAAANFAWCNRHIIGHEVREVFREFFGAGAGEIRTVYDVAHNIARIEQVSVGGKSRDAYVHRKGATRALGPGRSEVPADYRSVGQPVMIPGSMGTASWLLVGGSRSEEASLSSTAHGAGRMMSRNQAIKRFRAESLVADLARAGIHVRGTSRRGLAEEAPGAYKDVDAVVEVSRRAGIATPVARLRPVAVMKG